MSEEMIENFMMKSDQYGIGLSGIKVISVSKGYAKCSMKIENKHMNSHNITHGGAIFTLVDVAAGIAAAFDRSNIVTLTSNITYAAPAKGGVLYAEAKLQNESRRILNYFITVTDDTGKVVATATSSMYDRAPAAK